VGAPPSSADGNRFSMAAKIALENRTGFSGMKATGVPSTCKM